MTYLICLTLDLTISEQKGDTLILVLFTPTFTNSTIFVPLTLRANYESNIHFR